MKDNWSKNIDIEKFIDIVLDVYDAQLINAELIGELNNEPVWAVSLETLDDDYDVCAETYYFNAYGNVCLTKDSDFIQFGLSKHFKAMFEYIEQCNKGKLIDGKTYREAFKELHKELLEKHYAKKANEAKMQYVTYVNKKIRSNETVDNFFNNDNEILI